MNAASHAGSTIAPSSEFRDKLRARGGESAGRCMQCATCSTACELAAPERPFPRRQVLWAQWGLADRLAGDPSVWLCHQCNDCTKRCPRDARPGDVVAAVRALVIERLAFPGFLGRLVGNARAIWPLLVGLPILFWVALLGATGHLALPGDLAGAATLASVGAHYGQVVPHGFIYAVYFSATAFVLLAAWTGGVRLWRAMGESQPRTGAFLPALLAVVKGILTHERFGECGEARPRRLGHLLLFWGFAGAAVTSGLLIVALYILRSPMPLPQTHPFKLLGNLSAILLAGGALAIVANRWGNPKRAGVSTAFDRFFLGVVLLVIATGILVELARYALPPLAALALYIVHLGAVLTLFLTFPYSKFAHMLYRTLALAHERMVAPRP